MGENRIKKEFTMNLQGNFLVATPNLAHSEFERSVILVLQDDQYGTFGVALNQIASSRLTGDFNSSLGIAEPKRSPNLVGGDDGAPIFAIHQSRDLADLEIPGGIFLSSEAEKLNALMEQINSPYRIVLGVMGWEYGEIQSEIKQGLWCPMSATPEQIFGDPKVLWQECWKQFGRQQLSEVVGKLRFPINPQLN